VREFAAKEKLEIVFSAPVPSSLKSNRIGIFYRAGHPYPFHAEPNVISYKA